MKDYLNNFQRLRGFESSPLQANSSACVAPPEPEMIFKFQKAQPFERFPPRVVYLASARVPGNATSPEFFHFKGL